MRSVLAPDDKMQPAPLQPPRPLAYPRAPFIAIGTAAGVALLAWTAVVLLARRAAAAMASEPQLPPAERFRNAVQLLRRNPRAPQRWARLADETRLFLSSLDLELGTELTTTELLTRLYGAPPPSAGPLGGGAEIAAEGGGAPLERDSAATIATILRQGDLEKFSPWGPSPRDFDSAAASALLLIPAEEEAKAA
jgi:hypothetical protein